MAVTAKPLDSAGSLRLGRLDGLRGVAACVVAFGYHSRNLFEHSALDGVGPVVTWFYTWGWTFVDLFFLISGYIFAHVYLSEDRLRAPGAVKDFAVARFARLYPLHLVMLLACAALFWGKEGNGPLAFAAHLAMMQAFVSPVAHTFDGPTWSLSIEVVCYFLFALGASSSGRLLGKITATAILTGLVLIACFGLPGGPWVSDLLPRGLLGFFTGQLLWHQRVRLAQVPAWLLAALLIAGLALIKGQWSPLLPLGLIAWPAAILLALRLPALESKVMLWLGDRSYAIYLVHLPLVDAVVAQTGPLSGSTASLVAVTAGFVAAVLLLSELSFRLIESPARRAIRTVWDRHPPGRAALTSTA